MRFVGTLLLFGGYTLIYAAVANRGKFATEPWLGLFTDAYAKVPDSKSGNQPAPVSPNVPPKYTPVRPRVPGLGHPNPSNAAR